MYQEYKDIAEFRMVYIKEAHAADSNWSVPYAKEKGITEHDNYEERCTSARMLLDDESLTIPCLIDSMDDAVNQDYRAWPDRVFVVRTDGRLAVAAAQGPRGFEPALRETRAWLKAFKRDGVEPALPGDGDNELNPEARAKEAAEAAATLATLLFIKGSWDVSVADGREIVTAEIRFTDEGDFSIAATWTEEGRSEELIDVEVEQKVLRFKRRISEDEVMAFDGLVEGGKITGRFRAGDRDLVVTATRKARE